MWNMKTSLIGVIAEYPIRKYAFFSLYITKLPCTCSYVHVLMGCHKKNTSGMKPLI